MLFRHIYDSPVGQIGILIEDDILTEVSFTDPYFANLEAKENTKSFKHIITQLDEYFQDGRKCFELNYRVRSTQFKEKIYQLMSEIPYGQVLTYSDLARKANKPKAFRAVGTACGKNPLPLIIPCHRVVSKQGLGGFTGGLEIKKFLLNLERN